GANIEIREEVGPDNIFIFGLTVPEVRRLKAEGPYRPVEVYRREGAVRRVLDSFPECRFCANMPGLHDWASRRMLAENEAYLHLADLPSYLRVHEEVGRLYADPSAWMTKAIRNVARSGKFSSDRTIREYADDIWGLRSVPG